MRKSVNRNIVVSKEVKQVEAIKTRIIHGDTRRILFPNSKYLVGSIAPPGNAPWNPWQRPPAKPVNQKAFHEWDLFVIKNSKYF